MHHGAPLLARDQPASSGATSQDDRTPIVRPYRIPTGVEPASTSVAISCAVQKTASAIVG